MALYEDIRADLDAQIKAYKLIAGDGSVTIREASVWFLSTLVKAIRLVESAGGTGIEKKRAVLEAIDSFYTDVIAPIDLPGIPNVIEKSFIDPAIGGWMQEVTSGLIDSVVEELDNTGSF